MRQLPRQSGEPRRNVRNGLYLAVAGIVLAGCTSGVGLGRTPASSPPATETTVPKVSAGKQAELISETEAAFDALCVTVHRDLRSSKYTNKLRGEDIDITVPKLNDYDINLPPFPGVEVRSQYGEKVYIGIYRPGSEAIAPECKNGIAVGVVDLPDEETAELYMRGDKSERAAARRKASYVIVSDPDYSQKKWGIQTDDANGRADLPDGPRTYLVNTDAQTAYERMEVPDYQRAQESLRALEDMLTEK